MFTSYSILKSFFDFYPHTLTLGSETPCISGLQTVRASVRDGEGKPIALDEQAESIVNYDKAAEAYVKTENRWEDDIANELYRSNCYTYIAKDTEPHLFF